MFGGPRLRRGDRVVDRFRTRKTAALLAYLACHPGRRHPREVLAELLWPDSDPDASRKSLSVALSALRRDLDALAAPGPSPLQSDHFAVWIDSGAARTDVGELEAALKAAEAAGSAEERRALLARAVEHAAEPLLPGCYEDWVPGEQERLGAAVDRALAELVALHEAEGRYEEALEFARRRVARDPLSEAARRDPIRLSARLGRLPEARRRYAELEDLLRRELDVEPSAETRALLAQLPALAQSSVLPAESVALPAQVVPYERRLTPAVVSGDGTGTQGEAPPTPQSWGEPPAVAKGCVTPNTQHPTPNTCPHTHTHPHPLTHTAPLPETWTRFVGRESEREWLGRVFRGREARLVTLTGSAGMGKTRLAVEAARELQQDGVQVWFASMAEVTEPTMLLQRLAAVLDVPASPMETLLERVARILFRPEHSLLVLDNFEQVEERGAVLVRRLLERTPGLACLVTSRHRLKVAGERELPLAPLGVPSREAADDASPSVQLFVDRARAVRPEFALDAANAPAVRALCARLEGVPLALELAAAWMDVLSPAQMLERLAQGQDLLLSRQVAGEVPQRSLQAALDTSYQLLTPELRQLFARLSVFHGGWSVEAAEAILGSDLPPGAVLHGLARLRECSLVLAEERGGEMRGRMLNLVRAYAGSHLEPETRRELYRRHAEWFAQRALEIELRPHHPGPAGGAGILDRDDANYRAAVVWCRSPEGDPRTGLLLTGELGWYWGLRGCYRDAWNHLSDLLERPENQEPTRYRALALNAAATVLGTLGEDDRALGYFERGLELGLQLGEILPITHAQSGLAWGAYTQGDYRRAHQLWQECLETKRAHGLPIGQGGLMNALAEVALILGDRAGARRRYEEVLEFAGRIGDRRCFALATSKLGEMAQQEGDLATARTLLERALVLRQEIGECPSLSDSEGALGVLALAEGDLPEARRRIEASLQTARELEDRGRSARALGVLAQVAAAEGNLDVALAHAREALELRLPTGRAGELLESVEQLGALHAARGEAEWAVRLLAAARAARERTGAVPTPDIAAEVETALAAARAALDPERVAGAWAEGSGLGLREVVGGEW